MTDLCTFDKYRDQVIEKEIEHIYSLTVEQRGLSGDRLAMLFQALHDNHQSCFTGRLTRRSPDGIDVTDYNALWDWILIQASELRLRSEMSES